MTDNEFECTVTNEFAKVDIKKVSTDQGHRLEISSGDHTIRLDAVALEAISWQDLEQITKLIESSPRGPYEEFPQELLASYPELSNQDES